MLNTRFLVKQALFFALALSVFAISPLTVNAQRLNESVEREVSSVLKAVGFYSSVQWCAQFIPSKITCALGPSSTGIPNGMVDIYLNPQLWCVYKGMWTDVPENLLGAFDQNGRTVSVTRCRR